MGGTPVFMGTRVPIKNLLDYLKGGHTLEEFLDHFPSVEREQVVSLLEAVIRSRKPSSPDQPQPVINRDPDIMSCIPVFNGTHVPVKVLIDYLQRGKPLGEFLADFPTVSEEKATAVLELAKRYLVAHAT